MRGQAIFTAQEDAERIALRELKACAPEIALDRMLAPGVGLLSLPGGFQALARALHDAPPIFVRHICPADAEVALDGGPEDLKRLEAAATALLPGFSGNAPVSVQTRALGALPAYKRFDINEALASILTEAGLALDVRKPQEVLSVVLEANRAHLGVSDVRDNRSDWAGGCRRFAKEQARISRAEFKLLEALEVFGLTLPNQGHAVDLGAAPGGWTHVLRERGLRVTAVDPAALDPRILNLPGIEHRPVTAQVFFQNPVRCDLLVNDMKMDSDASATLMAEAAPCLTEGGQAILTLKLPADNWESRVRRALQTLRKAYSTVEARQLFHNRSEVTCALRR
ncbi:MAG TPA: SAM-dependent methyltransferase [Clostridia bacterium]|nr:SAM-dependent methyltransferase [Clostridia bacterium]